MKGNSLATFEANKISWEIVDKIGYLSFIDNPQNRMDSIFFQELNHLTKSVITQSSVKAIVIHGKGRHFSSGANIDELIEKVKDEDDGPETLTSNYGSFQFFEELNVPVIAVLRGVCLGSALELALHCHFRLCSEDALLGLPESTFGLMPGAGGITKILEIAGKAKAIELALRGNTFNAEDALQWGVVDAVFSKKEVLEEAELLAKLTSTNYRKYNKKDYLSNLLKH
jgi:enoyl-CoA hydratase/carnithine racemase